jgi:hypothetical protein
MDNPRQYTTRVPAHGYGQTELWRTSTEVGHKEDHLDLSQKIHSQNELRKETRVAEMTAYHAFHDAHAKGLTAKFYLSTSPDGNIIGSKTRWHAVVRSATECTLDYSIIREYSRNAHQWNCGSRC